jgi:hypothetical protein
MLATSEARTLVIATIVPSGFEHVFRRYEYDLQFNQRARGRILVKFLLLLSKNDMFILTWNETALCVDMSTPF